MCEERVEVGLGTEMEDLLVVSVIEVGEHAQKLAVDVFDSRREVG